MKLRGNRIERLFNQLQNNRAQCGVENKQMQKAPEKPI